MSNQKKTHELIRQNEQIVKKSQKHDVNLQKNSMLYFQVGLIICLLFTFGLFEMTFKTHIPVVTKLDIPIEQDFTVIPLIKTVKPTPEEPVKQKKIKQSQDFIEAPDDKVLEQVLEKLVDEPISNSPDVNPDFTELVEEPVIDEPVGFISVEVVPVYPGCEKRKTNSAKRKCMSEKITKLVQRKFNTGLGGELGLFGTQTIRTQFKIDKTGNVIDIKARGTHAKLESEAERVINIIPKMIPGKQQDKNVSVIYTLPIVFQVQ